MTKLNWRNIIDKKPEDGQSCLTRMKHGIIEGVYDAKENSFSGYYWTDLEWYGHEWVPSEEV